jgi:hypothetical protein
LKNYLRGLCGVKNGLKMLIYFSKLERQPGPFSAIFALQSLPRKRFSTACYAGVFSD